MRLPAGGGSLGGQAEGPDKCWGGVLLFDAYGKPRGEKPCQVVVRVDDGLRLCPEHFREMIDAGRHGPAL